MHVRDLMTSPAITCNAQDSLETAARLLWEHDCGFLPVVDRGGRVGATITDRDICMAAYTQGRRLSDMRVADSMSKTIVACKPDDDVATAVQHMRSNRVRRLPVVDDDGRACGVLSLNDLATRMAADAASGNVAVQVLRSVCGDAETPVAQARVITTAAASKQPVAARAIPASGSRAPGPSSASRV